MASTHNINNQHDHYEMNSPVHGQPVAPDSEMKKVMEICNKALKQRHDGKALMITSAVVLGAGVLALAGVGAVTGAGVVALTIGLPVLVAVAIATAVVALALFLPGIILHTKGNNAFKNFFEAYKIDISIVSNLFNSKEYKIIDELMPCIKKKLGNDFKDFLHELIHESLVGRGYGKAPDYDAARIELALRHGADINKDCHGNCLISRIIDTQDVKALKLMLKYNPDLTLQDDRGFSPLLQAIRLRRYDENSEDQEGAATVKEIINILLPLCKHTINDKMVDNSNEYGNIERSPLQYVLDEFYSAKVRNEVVKLMVANGADVNASITPDNDLTPLMVAVFRQDLDQVKLLVDLKADPSRVNKDKKTALMLAQEQLAKQWNGSEELEEIIRILNTSST